MAKILENPEKSQLKKSIAPISEKFIRKRKYSNPHNASVRARYKRFSYPHLCCKQYGLYTITCKNNSPPDRRLTFFLHKDHQL